MAVITISRQYGSGGNEIASRICAMLGYRHFDKRLMADVAFEVGLSDQEIVDFSEDNYNVRSFMDRLLEWRRGPRVVAQVGTWTRETTGARSRALAEMDETMSVGLVQATIDTVYKYGNVVIVGRGGQAILKEKPDVLHVRIEAPEDVRNQRIRDREGISLSAAQDMSVRRNRAAADYLKRFHNIDWENPMLYDLVINTGKLGIEAAAHLVVNAVSYLPPAESSD